MKKIILFAFLISGCCLPSMKSVNEDRKLRNDLANEAAKNWATKLGKSNCNSICEESLDSYTKYICTVNCGDDYLTLKCYSENINKTICNPIDVIRR